MASSLWSVVMGLHLWLGQESVKGWKDGETGVPQDCGLWETLERGLGFACGHSSGLLSALGFLEVSCALVS